jgi:hypothetical protein
MEVIQFELKEERVGLYSPGFSPHEPPPTAALRTAWVELRAEPPVGAGSGSKSCWAATSYGLSSLT